jgi:hypothetical protein
LFLLLGEGPDGFVLEFEQVDPALVALEDDLPFCDFPGQVVWVDFNAGLDRFGDQVFRLFLQVA